MACSRFEYVKNFESQNIVLPNCWMVVRLDGRGFTRFAHDHQFTKPNDLRALHLMNRAAQEVMVQFPTIVLAYGQSDEYRYMLLLSVESWKPLCCNASYAFEDSFLKPLYIPSFDGRVVCYPTDENLRDYLSWRQADCHINNQYNTCFWSLVQKGGLSKREAYKALQGTQTAEKNELLFSRFDINYNRLPEIFRKGSILLKTSKDRKAAGGDMEHNDPPSRDKSVEGCKGGSSEKTAHAPVDADTTDQTMRPKRPLELEPDRTGENGGNNSCVEKASNVTNGDVQLCHNAEVELDCERSTHGVFNHASVERHFLVIHEDMISEKFWNRHSHILGKPKK